MAFATSGQLHEPLSFGTSFNRTLQDVQKKWTLSVVRKHNLQSISCLHQKGHLRSFEGPQRSIKRLFRHNTKDALSETLFERTAASVSSKGITAASASTSGKGFGPLPKNKSRSSKTVETAGDYFKLLGDEVGKQLRGVPVYLIGDDGDANAAVAEELAPALGYVPFQTAKLIQQTTGKGLALLEAEEGREGIEEAEASIISELSTFVRCAIGTIGSGAAADPSRWNHLHGGISVWLDCTTATASTVDHSTKGPKQLGYTKSDVVVRFSLPEGATWQPNVTRAVAEGVLEGIKKLLADNQNYAGKKSLYVRSGCRGDWPNLAEPGAEVTPDSIQTIQTSPVKEIVLGEQR